MPWARLDDSYFTNPKILAADAPTMLMHLASVAYCARELTDGLVVTGAVPLIGAMAKQGDTAPIVASLVALGLWRPCDKGWMVNDFLTYNPSRAQVEAERSAARERMSRRRSGELRPNIEPRSDYPVPVPVPVPVPQESSTPETVGSTHMAPAAPRGGPETVKPPRYSKPFDAFWAAYPSQDGRAWPKPATYAIWQRLKPDGELADAILAGVTAWLQGRDWQRGYIMRPDRWLKERSWEEPPEPWSGIDEAAVRAPPAAPTRYSANHIDTAQAARDFDLARNGGYANGQHPGPAPGARIVPRQLASPVPGP